MLADLKTDEQTNGQGDSRSGIELNISQNITSSKLLSFSEIDGSTQSLLGVNSESGKKGKAWTLLKLVGLLWFGLLWIGLTWFGLVRFGLILITIYSILIMIFSLIGRRS